MFRNLPNTSSFRIISFKSETWILTESIRMTTVINSTNAKVDLSQTLLREKFNYQFIIKIKVIEPNPIYINVLHKRKILTVSFPLHKLKYKTLFF